MSNFWYRVRRGWCSISMTLTKLDFNVHAVSACICKQCHGRRIELNHLPQNLKDFTDFFQRWLRWKREERATLLSVERSLQETTNFNFASQHRSQRDRRLKANYLLWYAKTFRTSTFAFSFLCNSQLLCNFLDWLCNHFGLLTCQFSCYTSKHYNKWVAIALLLFR